MEKLNYDIENTTSKETIEMMEKAYATCPAAMKYAKQLGIPEEVIFAQIYKVYDFVCDINYCKHCPGVEKCNKRNPLTITKIEYKNGILDKAISPCNKIIDRVLIEKQFETKDFNEEWTNADLKELSNSAGRKEALMQYLNFAKNKEFNWIYLTGGSGSGKSYVAANFVIDAAKKKLGPICFLNSPKRIRELSELSSKKNGSFEQLLNTYMNANILVLDEFGNEFINDYIRDNIILPILTYRSSKKLFTIFTSDFEFSDIEILYANSKAGALRAKQIIKILKGQAKKEIDLGSIAAFE